MTDPKKYFALSIVITLVIFSLPALFVWVVDPFQVHHKLWVHKDSGFDATDRYQNAGLINSYLADPDLGINSVIIGSSMSQNFDVSTMKNKKGVEALRLTLAGGSARELHFLTNKAIATGNVKNVLWEIHAPYVGSDPMQMHSQSPLPLFLYDHTVWNDWRYMFNNDVVEESMGLLKGKLGRRVPLDKLYTWTNEDRFAVYSTQENIGLLRKKLEEVELPLAPKPSPEMETFRFPNVEQHLIPVLKAHPDINFSLFFPPISYYGMAAKGSEAFWKDMMMRRAVLNGVKDLPNVHVYSFDLEKGIGDTIELYQDVEHYRPKINGYMVDKMNECKNRVTAESWEADTAKLVKKVNRYASRF